MHLSFSLPLSSIRYFVCQRSASEMSGDQRTMIKGSPSQYVKLNVGGTLYYATIGTLTKYDNMLKAMFSGRMEVLTDSEGKLLCTGSVGQTAGTELKIGKLKLALGWLGPAHIGESLQAVAAMTLVDFLRNMHMKHQNKVQNTSCAIGLKATYFYL